MNRLKKTKACPHMVLDAPEYWKLNSLFILQRVCFSFTAITVSTIPLEESILKEPSICLALMMTIWTNFDGKSMLLL